jgi:hypothetical protein
MVRFMILSALELLLVTFTYVSVGKSTPCGVQCIPIESRLFTASIQISLRIDETFETSTMNDTPPSMKTFNLITSTKPNRSV